MHAIANFILAIVDLFISAYVAQIIWNWYMPLFGVIRVGYWHAFGLLMCVRYFTSSIDFWYVLEGSETNSDGTTKMVVSSILRTLGIWLVAWLCLPNAV